MWKDILVKEDIETNIVYKRDPLPKVCNKFKNNKRKCQIPNYIPRQVQYNNYIGWKLKYDTHLINMYNLTFNKSTFTEKNFENFCKMIYYCSSKYITKYI